MRTGPERQDYSFYEKARRWLFALLSAGAAACAVARAMGFASIDRDVLFFLLAACVFLVLERVKKFSFGKDGFSAELVEQLRSELSDVKEKVGEVAEVAIANQIAVTEGVGGRKPEEAAKEREAGLGELLPPPGQIDSTDPQKGRFGGRPERNGRRLSASVVPALESLGIYQVKLKVTSTEPDRPLSGDVLFYLHPTFERDVRRVAVKDGVARLYLLSYGAFTVGAVVDGGDTLLELDLAVDERFPKEFRER